jgi:hypothetical protein
MMRQPSPMKQLYAWHSAALAGDNPARHPRYEGCPEAGWYKIRFTKGGPWVAVEIRVEREIDPEIFELSEPERFIAITEGERRNAVHLWGSSKLEPISRAEHDALTALTNEIPAMQASRVAMILPEEPIRP